MVVIFRSWVSMHCWYNWCGVERLTGRMRGGVLCWRMRFSFRNATFLLCFFNLAIVLLLLQGFIGISTRRFPRNQPDPAQIRYAMESEALRLAMEPKELLSRVKEIQHELNAERGMSVQQKTPKQTAAQDLSKRLQDFRSMNDANSKKGPSLSVAVNNAGDLRQAISLQQMDFSSNSLEEWWKRKMERARQREMEKNGTITAT